MEANAGNLFICNLFPLHQPLFHAISSLTVRIRNWPIALTHFSVSTLLLAKTHTREWDEGTLLSVSPIYSCLVSLGGIKSLLYHR